MARCFRVYSRVLYYVLCIFVCMCRAPLKISLLSGLPVEILQLQLQLQLHRELRDYSLGQIAFAVFRALFAITQLLCHVSALLTSACKQA